MAPSRHSVALILKRIYQKHALRRLLHIHHLRLHKHGLRLSIDWLLKIDRLGLMHVNRLRRDVRLGLINCFCVNNSRRSASH